MWKHFTGQKRINHTLRGMFILPECESSAHWNERMIKKCNKKSLHSLKWWWFGLMIETQCDAWHASILDNGLRCALLHCIAALRRWNIIYWQIWHFAFFRKPVRDCQWRTTCTAPNRIQIVSHWIALKERERCPRSAATRREWIARMIEW